MKHIRLTLLLLPLLAVFVLAQDPSWHQVPKEDLLGNRGEIAKTIQSTQNENILLDIWKRSETEEGILYLKMLAAKRLGLYGTKAAVPVLVARLGNDKDGFYARYALETIPGDEVDVALGEALKTIEKPDVLAGILTTLGVRANPVSAEVAKSFLTHADTDVRRAASYAYALTAGESGIAFFTNANLDPLFIDSGFLFAEQFAHKGNNAAAVRVYDALAAAANAREYQKMAAIYQGALARGQEGVRWLYAQMLPPNVDVPRRLFEVGLKAGRELPTDKRAMIVRTLVTQFAVNRTDPQRQARIVRVIGDRQDTASTLPLITRLASGESWAPPEGPQPPAGFDATTPVVVRVAAIDALRNIGDASVLPTLIAAATQTDEKSVADAARKTLIEMSGEGIDEAILVALQSGGTPAVKVALMNIVAERRIFAASPILLKLLQDSDASVSEAATSALGQISGIDDLPVMLGLFRQAQSEAEANKLLNVLKSACTRFSQDAAATEIAKVLEVASTAQLSTFRAQLLDLLKEIAGARALAIVTDYAFGTDAEMRNVATRILGEWRSPPDLNQLAAACLRVAKESAEYKIRGLRAYIRLARQFDMPEERRLQMCQEVFDLADRDEERVLIFDVLSRLDSVKALEMAASHLGNASFRERAAETAVVIGRKLPGQQPQAATIMDKVVKAVTNADVKLQAESLFTRFSGGNEGVEIVRAVYGVDNRTADVTEKVRQLSGGNSSFEIGSYNAAFGDVAPQTVKTLKITYKIKGGPERTVTFPENRPIVLPAQ